jgi:hypothetical protein
MVSVWLYYKKKQDLFFILFFTFLKKAHTYKNLDHGYRLKIEKTNYNIFKLHFIEFNMMINIQPFSAFMKFQCAKKNRADEIISSPLQFIVVFFVFFFFFFFSCYWNDWKHTWWRAFTYRIKIRFAFNI